jgi:GNAT superfamily N-acetyltransferase
MNNWHIELATTDKVEAIVKFIDSTFTKEGYGFVTSAQINTETKRGAAYIALTDSGEIIGVRIGKDRVYNLAVHPDYRKQGIGKALIEILPPSTIRVKAIPVGHLSNKQRETFKSPRGFYEAIGFVFDHLDFARNFWQKAKDKAVFHKQGERKHIEIYKRKSDIEE